MMRVGSGADHDEGWRSEGDAIATNFLSILLGRSMSAERGLGYPAGALSTVTYARRGNTTTSWYTCASGNVQP